MKDRVSEFLRFLEIQRNASPHTIRAYRKDLGEFTEFIKKDPAEIDLTDIRGYLATQIKKGLSKTSAGRKLASVRSYLRYLHREGMRIKPREAYLRSLAAEAPAEVFVCRRCLCACGKASRHRLWPRPRQGHSRTALLERFAGKRPGGAEYRGHQYKRRPRESHGKGRKERIVPWARKQSMLLNRIS